MSIDKVREPNKVSEFEVHAYVWSELRKLGINARGEVKVPFKDEGNRRAMCRFDIGIFDDGFLVGIIEIKAHQVRHKTEGGWEATRQGSRYMSFGVPVEIVYGQPEAELFIEITKTAGRICWA